MPRWSLIAIALVAYALVMGGLALVLNATVPGAVGWLQERIGVGAVGVLMVTIFVPVALYGYWPRRPDGTMRRLRSPWD